MIARSGIVKLRGASDDEVFFRLGEGLVHAHAPPGVACSAPYIKLGKELWLAIEYDLRKVLCEGSKPKAWTAQALGGDEKDLGVAIITILMAQFEATLAIAVPATVLLIRRGLGSFCQRKPRRPKRSTKAIMSSWKRSWERDER